MDFHSCCHGGQRPKLTRFWVSQDHFSQLSMFCDNTHWHKPWTPRKVGNRLHFVTADEAAYPLLLCQRLMDALLELCFPNADLHAAQTSISFHDKSTRVALGIQPAEVFLRNLPKGSKVVQRRLFDGGVIRPSPESTSEVHFHDMPDLTSCDASVFDQWKKTQIRGLLHWDPLQP